MQTERRNVQTEVYDTFKDIKYLSSTEKSLFKGLKTKKAKAVEENIVRKAVGLALASEEEIELEDGTKVVVTQVERLAARTVQEAMQNPSTQKLKDFAHMMGEDKVIVEAKTTGSDFFLGICAGDNVDEIVEKEGETTSDDSNS